MVTTRQLSAASLRAAGGLALADVSPLMPGAFPNLKRPAYANPSLPSGDTVAYTVPPQ